MDFLKPFSTDISNLCKSHKVKSLHAFGSVVTEAFNDESDVDLIVEFNPMDVEGYADNYFDLKFSLEKILNRDIDLLESQAIKIRILNKISKNNSS